MKIAALLLIVLGIVALAYGGFSFTTKEKVADLGPVDITRDKTNTVPLTPIAGVVAIIGGGLLLAADRKRA